jgi:hypothetical protein
MPFVKNHSPSPIRRGEKSEVENSISDIPQLSTPLAVFMGAVLTLALLTPYGVMSSNPHPFVIKL